MIDLLPLAIGLGLVVALLYAEAFSVTPGGMVVPGYLALHIHRPLDILLTFVAALIAFVVVRGASEVMIVYGRRRTALAILVGFLVASGFRWILTQNAVTLTQDFAIIGFLIPGLIAIWLDRQGLVATVASALTIAVVVRLVLILVVGAGVIT